LQDAAHLRIPAEMTVLGSKTPNAFAMPGGKVYLLEGLLTKAQSQDEVIGVLAHELGHLEHRDHMRRIIATGGTAMIVSIIFGDVSGGAVMVALGNTLLGAAHSREAETQADDFAKETMARLGRPAKPMGELLVRITGEEKTDGLMTILRDHPVSEDRLARLAKADKGATRPPVLTDEEWRALKGICDSK
ncbi:MAG: M48 family metallopeptidase, partial [Methylocystis sp.]|nr:M48 family metallopeptidase [Methylocystis sp.]